VGGLAKTEPKENVIVPVPRQQWMLNVLDEFSHECLAIRVARKLTAIDVITGTTQRGLITIVSAIG